MRFRSLTLALPHAIAICLSLLSSGLTWAAPTQQQAGPILESCTCSGGACSLTLLWGNLPANVSEISLTRNFLAKNGCFGDHPKPARKGIQEGDVVRLTIKQFNFLKYELQVEKDERLIEAYAHLNVLWGQILGLGGLRAMAAGELPPSERDEFLEALLAWERAMALLNGTISSNLTRYSESGLTPQQVDAIADAALAITEQVQEMTKAEANAINVAVGSASKVQTDVKFRLIQEFRAKQSEVAARATAFLQRAEKVAVGVTRIVKGSKAGNIVTITATAVQRDGLNEDRAVSLRYFVGSRLPVLLHGGYGQADLSELEFEKVRTADGFEAYDIVKDEGEFGEFMVFLSAPIYTVDERQDFELLATLGTGLTDVGEELFAGLSAKVFGRYVLSYGWLSAEVAEGVDPFVEEIGSELDTRQLFATIDKRRDWGNFWGVSFIIDF